VTEEKKVFKKRRRVEKPREAK
jgi:hypothetical protein